jgi:hypothetical protein
MGRVANDDDDDHNDDIDDDDMQARVSQSVS